MGRVSFLRTKIKTDCRQAGRQRHLGVLGGRSLRLVPILPRWLAPRSRYPPARAPLPGGSRWSGHRCARSIRCGQPPRHRIAESRYGWCGYAPFTTTYSTGCSPQCHRSAIGCRTGRMRIGSNPIGAMSRIRPPCASITGRRRACGSGNMCMRGGSGGPSRSLKPAYAFCSRTRKRVERCRMRCRADSPENIGPPSTS